MQKMAKRRRPIRLTAMVPVIAMIAAGCTTGGSQPLMSAWNDETEYGYNDRKLDGSGYRIEYTTPFTRTTADAKRREEAIADLRRLAYDLALWRAAEIAAREGYKAFAITDRRFEPNLRAYNDVPDIPRLSLAHPQGGVWVTAPSRFDFKSMWLQGRQTIDIRLQREMGAGALDTEATIRRLSREHGNVRIPSMY
jgi:hypothetical protein